jgi:hypothetical protein
VCISYFLNFILGGFYLGRKRIAEELRKENITISLPAYQIVILREIKNYNKLISKLLEDYLKNK